jgi:DNA-binding beta-propeller fold protein YncE
MTQYKALERWEQLPTGYTWPEVVGVAVDRHDRAFVFNRGEHPVIVFDREGRFVTSWGEGVFARPHGITIGPDDTIYCCDDFGHCVYKFTLEGKLLLTLGTPGRASDTGATSIDYRTIKRASGPFHFPTNLALNAAGDMYIADGYGNARIHKFSAKGEFLFSWGEPGCGPGQFHVPHGIAIDSKGIVFVADRENSRLQLFSPEGVYLSKWTDVARPCQVYISSDDTVYVAELGYRAGMWPGTTAPSANATGGRVSIFDRQGKLLTRWGGGMNPTAPGDFFAPHDICLDSKGDLYVSEVTWSGGGSVGIVPADCHALQKFVS